MSPTPTEPTVRGTARTKLLDSAIDVIRRQGLHATTVDHLCSAAGVTKGAFFHHFDSKEELAVEAASHWSSVTGAMFAAASYHDLDHPADRVLAYVDLREAMIQGEPAEFTCLAGTMVQEAFDTSPAVRDACRDSIFDHASTLEADIAAALAQAGNDTIDAAGLARHTQAVLQGGFILAKASNDATPALESIAHLRSYLTMLFGSGSRPDPGRTDHTDNTIQGEPQ